MKISNKMIINLTLSDNFVETIKATMFEEIETACKKWNVVLNTDEEDHVVCESLKQVRRKTSENIRTVWDFSDSMIVRVNSPKQGVEISLPDPAAEKSPIVLLHTRDGWGIDPEKRDGSVRLADFHTHMQELILTWARTAVYYGVASYT